MWLWNQLSCKDCDTCFNKGTNKNNKKKKHKSNKEKIKYTQTYYNIRITWAQQ